MIKSITINYPNFWSGLKIDREFKPWLNLIEESNAWWKTTLWKTIMSIYTGKFGNSKTLPEWFSSVETDKTKYVLSKKSWIWKDFEDNELYLYTMPGLFFNALSSTPKQREVLVKLLWLDYVSFMKDKISKNIKGKEEYFHELVNFNEWTEKELKDKLKDSLTKEWTILEDIQRYKSQLINKEEKDFTDVLEYRELVSDIQRQAQEHNRWLFDIQQQYQKLLSNIRTTENIIMNNNINITTFDKHIKSLNEQLQWLKTEYSIVQKQSTCDKCGSKLPEDKLKIRLDWILSTADKVKDNISIIEIDKTKVIEANEVSNNTLSKLKDKQELFILPETINTSNIEECVTKLNLNRVPKLEAWRELDYEEYQRYLNELSFIENELKIKEEQLKAIDSVRLENSLDIIKWFKKMFTEYLNKETKKLPVDIELFKQNKDGSFKESFIIRKDWVQYSELSTWNKSIVQLQLAKIFIDKLWIDFVLVDEWSLISKDNLSFIKDLAKTHQVLIFKPTWWTNKDLI